jgi:CBS domain-containing protein
MKVKELAQDIEICAFDDSLKKIAEIMQQHDFDVVPLVDQNNKLVGVITRDAVCEAAAKFDRKPSAVQASVLASEDLLICDSQEKFEKILKQLSKKRIKYAGFTSQNGKTIAIISLPKILSRATDDKKLLKKVFRAMEKISKPLPLVLSEVGFVPRSK